MGVLAVLAITAAIATMGAVGVAGLQVWRQAQRLLAAGRDAGARLSPLTEELTSELAVTSTEVEALQRDRSKL
jgi:hypothetical protein